MPLTFGRQLRDVPSIAMQLYNDCNHLASQVATLKAEFTLWSEDGNDLETRLKVFGQRSFEAQIVSVAAMTSLTDSPFTRKAWRKVFVRLKDLSTQFRKLHFGNASALYTRLRTSWRAWIARGE